MWRRSTGVEIPSWGENLNGGGEELDYEEDDALAEDPCASDDDAGDATFGPVAPPDMRNDDSTDDLGSRHAPSLPPDTTPSTSHGSWSNRLVGPCLPPGLAHDARDSDPDDPEHASSSHHYQSSSWRNPRFSSLPAVIDPVEEADLFGPPPPPDVQVDEPELPPDDEDGDEIIGPCLPSHDADDYEERLARVQAIEAAKNAGNRREQWMLELPKKLNHYGLGPRVFQKSAPRDDEGASSSWTETPSTRLLNKDPPAETRSAVMEKKRNEQRDKQLQQRADELTKDREDSLLDLHQRKRKAAEKPNDEDSSQLRRPFNRDTDLAGGSSKRAPSSGDLKERCGQLSSRFGHGSSTQKFL